MKMFIAAKSLLEITEYIKNIFPLKINNVVGLFFITQIA